MKYIKPISLLLLFVLLFSACTGGKTAEPAPSGETEPAQTAAVTDAQTSAAPTDEPTTSALIDRTAEDVYLNHPELTPVNYASPALLPASADAGQEYIDSITFVCDSPFYWLKLYGLLTGGTDTTQVWTGPEGTMTLAYLRDFKILDPFDKVERTIPDTAALHKPPMVLITIGINGVSFMDEEYFKTEYRHLIDVIHEASPETTILVQSILPIAPTYKNWGKITNATITAANRWIMEVAEEYGLHYLDSFSVLVGDDGNIKPELVMKDGLHANKDGLTLVLKYIRTHAYLKEN